jgi:metallo-beta-lactamase class B
VNLSRFILVSTLCVSGSAWLAGASQRLKPEEFLPEMNQPVEPAHIIGNIYYVGTNGVSSFLIVTPDGHILLDSGFNQSVPLIRDSITKLGFRVADIRMLLSTHAHFDHVAGHALIQQQTGAQIIASRRDAEIIARGGDELWEGWQGSRVDRIVGDNDVVRLGGVELRAHLTPGHTEGCTTWTMDTTEAGHRYHVVFVGGYGINPGVRLVGNTAYPRIVEDYARTFRVLKSLKPDVFLAQHPDLFAFDEKVGKLRAGAKQNPFIDAEGYRKAVQAGEDAYLEQLRRERSQRQKRRVDTPEGKIGGSMFGTWIADDRPVIALREQ